MRLLHERDRLVGASMSNRTTAIGIFLLAFGAVAWLSPQLDTPPCHAARKAQRPGFNPQVVTRLGLTLSIVGAGQLHIDRFADYTHDKAPFRGHYYADKVPGLSLLAIPVVAATGLVIMAAGGDVERSDKTN